MKRRSLWVVALALSGCQLVWFDDPETAFMRFFKGAQGRNPKAAFDALSSSTREILRQQASDISTASGGAIPNDPIPMTFGPPSTLTESPKPKAVKVTGDTALLTLEGRGRSFEVKMVRELKKWKVDLTAHLRDAAR